MKEKKKESTGLISDLNVSSHLNEGLEEAELALGGRPERGRAPVLVLVVHRVLFRGEEVQDALRVA